jgi:HK97 family phage major capsid protein
MSSDTKVVPRRTGGLTAYPVGENAAGTYSDKTFDQIRLTARKWMVLAAYSSELSEDAAINIGDDLAREAAYAMVYAEDNALFNGDGSSTHHGMIGLKNALGDGSEYTAATGNTAFSTLDLADFHGMKAKLADYAYRGEGPKWYISRAGYAASMEALQAAAGGNTVGNIADGGAPRFLGYPVVFSNVLNTTLTGQTSTDGLCYFGNLQQAVAFGDRRGIAMAMSDAPGFTSDLLTIKVTQRFDINVHDVGTSSVAGAVVMLKTPAS